MKFKIFIVLSLLLACPGLGPESESGFGPEGKSPLTRNQETTKTDFLPSDKLQTIFTSSDINPFDIEGSSHSPLLALSVLKGLEDHKTVKVILHIQNGQENHSITSTETPTANELIIDGKLIKKIDASDKTPPFRYRMPNSKFKIQVLDANTNEELAQTQEYTFNTNLGTQADPYLIKTPQALAGLAYLMEAVDTPSKVFLIDADKIIIPDGVKLKPIKQNFTGQFSGRDSITTISGLVIERDAPEGKGDTLGSGLFLFLRGGTVKNLLFMRPNIFQAGHTGPLGVIAASMEGGKIINVGVKAGTVRGDKVNAGGLVGQIIGEDTATIKGFFQGEVDSSGNSGGLVGHAAGTPIIHGAVIAETEEDEDIIGENSSGGLIGLLTLNAGKTGEVVGYSSIEVISSSKDTYPSGGLIGVIDVESSSKLNLAGYSLKSPTSNRGKKHAILGMEAVRYTDATGGNAISKIQVFWGDKNVHTHWTPLAESVMKLTKPNKAIKVTSLDKFKRDETHGFYYDTSTNGYDSGEELSSPFWEFFDQDSAAEGAWPSPKNTGEYLIFKQL